MLKKIKVDGLDFVMSLSDSGELSFAQVSEDSFSYRSLHNSKSPVKVMRAIEREAIAMIYESGKSFIYMSGADISRSRLYMKFAKKLKGFRCEVASEGEAAVIYLFAE